MPGEFSVVEYRQLPPEGVFKDIHRSLKVEGKLPWDLRHAFPEKPLNPYRGYFTTAGKFGRVFVLFEGKTAVGYIMLRGSIEEMGVRGVRMDLDLDEAWLAHHLRGKGLSALLRAPVIRLVREKCGGEKGGAQVRVWGKAVSAAGECFFQSFCRDLEKQTDFSVVQKWDKLFVEDGALR